MYATKQAGCWELPATWMAPIVNKSDSNSEAIISTLTLNSPTKTILEIGDYAENVIAPRFQTINGVVSYNFGDSNGLPCIWMEPAKMAALGITTQDIKNALDRENVDLPSGKLQGDMTELTVKQRVDFRQQKTSITWSPSRTEPRLIKLADRLCGHQRKSGRPF